MGAARAQDEAPAVAADHGNWMLKEREEWLHSRLDKARDERDINRSEYDRAKHELDRIHEDEETMRDHHDGQLTANQTTDLEARLDLVAGKIHWLHGKASSVRGERHGGPGPGTETGRPGVDPPWSCCVH
jgi:hypothetical protein